jgi:hypothetical protein
MVPARVRDRHDGKIGVTGTCRGQDVFQCPVRELIGGDHNVPLVEQRALQRFERVAPLHFEVEPVCAQRFDDALCVFVRRLQQEHAELAGRLRESLGTSQLMPFVHHVRLIRIGNRGAERYPRYRAYPSPFRGSLESTKAPRRRGFRVGAPRFELGTSSPPD